jgi:glycosyltransferase involved in cell wall biosynthesis
VCAAGDAMSLAAAIEKLVRRPEEARARGEAGRRKVFEHFSADAMAARMLAVCRKLAYS